MDELKRLQQLVNEHLVANKRTHIECEKLVEAIKIKLEAE